MNVYILDSDLVVIGIIDDFYTLIWAERYDEAGDFEIELPIHYDALDIFEKDNFVVINESEVVMVIEEKRPSTTEDAKTLIVSGQSSESILKRRWIDVETNVDDVIEDILYDFVNDHFVSPTDPKRAISIMSVATPPGVLTDTYDETFEYQSIYDICVAICKNSGFGFKLVKSGNKLEFSSYKGIDRSVNQSVVPPVIFSPQFDNVITSSYFESHIDKVTFVTVLTPDDLVYQTTDIWEEGALEPEGLERYEHVIETRIDRNPPQRTVTDPKFLLIAATRGREVIRENSAKGLFEGDFDVQGNFKYGIDFSMGDIVETIIEGRNTTARVTELVRSYSVEGITVYITMDFLIN